MNEDKNKEELEGQEDPTPTPEEQPEEQPEEEAPEETPEETEEEESEEQDIDFKKELEDLEGSQPPKRTQREKAIFTAKKIAEELEGMGVDSSEIFGKKTTKKEAPAEEEDVVGTRLNQFEARLEAKQLARSEDEVNVIMWYVVNKGLSVPDAHLLANKGRVQSFLGEQKRSNVRVAQGSNASGRKPAAKTPELSPAEQADLKRQGFVKQKDGSWEGKRMRVIFDRATNSHRVVKKEPVK